MADFTVATYKEAEATLKNRDLRQALFDSDTVFLKDTVVNLHGERHKRKRGILLGLLTREFYRDYQNKIFPAVLAEALEPVIAAGRGDMVEFGYRAVVNLFADTAGIDRERNQTETARLIDIVQRLALGTTIEQMISGSVEEVLDQIRSAVVEFDRDFYTPSAARRQALIDAGAELPRDVVTVMLRGYPDGELPREEMVKDVAMFINAGVFTLTNTLSDTIHEILLWCRTHPDARRQMLSDPATLQRFIWETFRLHPPQVVARRRATCPIHLATGDDLAEDDLIKIDVMSANRSEAVFGEDASEFNPYRTVPGRVPLPGLAFGAGPHACVGRILAAGVQITAENVDEEETEYGTVYMIVHALLKLGIDLDPDRTPTNNQTNIRHHFLSLPFVLRPELAVEG